MAQKEYRQTRFRRPAGATEILLVRHGESEPLVPGRPFPLVDGHGDPALAPEGHEQAERVAARLATQRIAAIYVTTLRRTAQTAAPLAAELGLTPTVEPDLREVHLGEWEGELFRQRVAEGHPIAVRMSEEERWDVIPGGEPKDDFIARLRGRARPHRGRPPRRAGRGLHPRRRDRPAPRAGRRAPTAASPSSAADNGSISHLVLHGDRWILRRFNDTAHLTDGMDLDPEPDLPMS